MMTSKPRARLMMITIALMISLSVPLLIGGHGLHLMTGSPSPAASPFDRHCDVVSCSLGLPVWLMLSLVILAPIGRARLQALLPVASIALPRLDPPPRFTL